MAMWFVCNSPAVWALFAVFRYALCECLVRGMFSDATVCSSVCKHMQDGIRLASYLGQICVVVISLIQVSSQRHINHRTHNRDVTDIHDE
jgi:hypothetical protein